MNRAVLALAMLPFAACSTSTPSAHPTSTPPPSSCDDLIVEASPPVNPRLEPPDTPSGSEVFTGSGDTWFRGLIGHRWGESVEFFNGMFYTKIGLYTLGSRPPNVTVQRIDGKGTGHAEFSPTGRGLPGPLPTGLFFSTPGCWQVVAKGSTGTAIVHVRVAESPHGSTRP